MVKLLKKLFVRLYISVHEKIWKKEVKVKYLFVKNKNSDKLVVVFSGFAGHYVPGKYNYIKTLSRNNVNKLYILDDFGYENVGSYYLGEKCSLYDFLVVKDLIEHISKKCGASEIVFCGSSKGGSAALLYGSLMGVTHIIAGSPQYRIADYLNQNDYHRNIMNSIKRSENEDESWLNNCIYDAIQEADKNIRITLIYSSLEESYDVDLKELIDDCKGHFENVELVDEMYTDHSDIGKYFSKLLPKLL